MDTEWLCVILPVTQPTQPRSITLTFLQAIRTSEFDFYYFLQHYVISGLVEKFNITQFTPVFCILRNTAWKKCDRPAQLIRAFNMLDNG